MENKGAKITRIVMVLLVVFFVAICIIGGVSSGKSYNENSSKTETTEAEIIRNTDHEPGRLPTKETETEEITTQSISEESTSSEEKITTENLEPLEVLDFGYTAYESFLTAFLEDECQTMIEYGVKIKNPNPNHAVNFVVIKLTSKDAYGNILNENEMPLTAIAAGDTVVCGGTIMYDGEVATTVEATVSSLADDGGYILQEESTAIYQDELVVSDVSERKNEDRALIALYGNVTNTSNFDINSYFPVMAVFYKDGKIIGGTLDYYEGLKSGDTMPFEIDVSYLAEDLQDYDHYEIYVGQ